MSIYFVQSNQIAVFAFHLLQFFKESVVPHPLKISVAPLSNQKLTFQAEEFERQTNCNTILHLLQLMKKYPNTSCKSKNAFLQFLLHRHIRKKLLSTVSNSPPLKAARRNARGNAERTTILQKTRRQVPLRQARSKNAPCQSAWRRRRLPPQVPLGCQRRSASP